MTWVKKTSQCQNDPQARAVTHKFAKERGQRDSLSLTLPSMPSRMLSLLMSLWITWFSCRNSKACRHCKTHNKPVTAMPNPTKQITTATNSINYVWTRTSKICPYQLTQANNKPIQPCKQPNSPAMLQQSIHTSKQSIHQWWNSQYTSVLTVNTPVF